MKKRIITGLILITLVCACILGISISAGASDPDISALPFDKELLYGRNQIKSDATDLKIYDTILEGLMNGETSIQIYPNNSYSYNAKYTVANVRGLYELVLSDNPQIFWLSNQFAYSYYNDANHTGDDAVVTKLSVNVDAGLDVASAKALFDKKIKSFTEGLNISPTASQYEKSKEILDAVVGHIVYDGTLSQAYVHSAYGALVNGLAVCDGYAELYQYLLYLNGIQSFRVTGVANSGEKTENHAWNLVRIDGQYYFSDPTWADGTNKPFYQYFNATSAYMNKTHMLFVQSVDIPVCTATAASYPMEFTFSDPAQITAGMLAEQIKQYGYARLLYTGNSVYTLSELSSFIDNNGSAIASSLGVGFGASMTQKGNEFHVYLSDETKFTEAAVSLGADFTVKYKINLSGVATNMNAVPTVKFYINGKSCTVNGTKTGNNEYVFDLSDIAPHMLGDKIKSELWINGRVFDKMFGYSVEKYCRERIADAGSTAQLKTLCADILQYGAMAQVYVGYKTDRLVNEGVTGQTAYVRPSVSDYTIVQNNPSSTASFAAAGLHFDSTNRIYYKINVTGDVSKIEMKINGAKSELKLDGDGTYKGYSGELYATQLDDSITVELYENGNLIQTLTYGVYNYVVNMDSKGGNISGLVKSLYNYSYSSNLYELQS